MRIRIFATLVLAAAGFISLGGCHDGYSSVGYSYNYGSYGSPCDVNYGYSYYPRSSYNFRYSQGGHGFGHGFGHGYGYHRGYSRGHGGGHRGGHSHCPY